MNERPPVPLLLACLRGGAHAEDPARLADPGADWPALPALVDHWRLAHALMQALPRLGPDAGPPPAVRQQLQAAHRAAVLRRLRSRDRAVACVERLLQAGVAAVCVGDTALLGMACDAATTSSHLPPQLLVRAENLERARQVLAQDDAAAAPAAELLDQWSPGLPTGPALTFDAVLDLAEPLGAETPGCLRAGTWHLLLHLWTGLGRRSGVPTLMRNVAAIHLLRTQAGDADADAVRVQARQAGLGAACEAAERLAQAWLGGAPAAAGPLRWRDQRLLGMLARRGPALAARASAWAEGARHALQAALAQAVAAPQRRVDIAPPPGAAPAARPRPGRVALTYDGEAYDGLGAQLQRIYSLYALARGLGLSYVHTPLQHLNYQGLLPMVNQQLDGDLRARANALFHIESDPFDLEHCVTTHMKYPPFEAIERHRHCVRDSGRDVLIRAHEGMHYTDPQPSAFHVLREVSPFRTLRPSGPLRVCVHMRRGDRVASQDPRLQPNGFFVQVCRQLGQALSARGLAHGIRLHTELPAQAYTLRPLREHMFIDLQQPVTVTPEEHRLEDFSHIPQLELVLNLGPMEALCEFASADVLVLSYSSFSYTGALLNPHGLVLTGPPQPPPRNFHAPLPGWLLTAEDGSIDPAALAQAIDAMLARRTLQSRGGASDASG